MKPSQYGLKLRRGQLALLTALMTVMALSFSMNSAEARKRKTAKKPSATPYVALQVASVSQLLRTSQNELYLKKSKTQQLMNLCKVIGQSQILLMQIDSRALKPKVASSVELSINELHRACDGKANANVDEQLANAWTITGQVQRRLTRMSLFLNQKFISQQKVKTQKGAT